jgi:hypothetical protein
MWLARLIGRLAADVVAFLRDKPFIPCQVQWDYRGEFVDPLFSNSDHRETVRLRYAEEDEDFDISTDTIGEFRETRQRWPNE